MIHGNPMWEKKVIYNSFISSWSKSYKQINGFFIGLIRVKLCVLKPVHYNSLGTYQRKMLGGIFKNNISILLWDWEWCEDRESLLHAHLNMRLIRWLFNCLTNLVHDLDMGIHEWHKATNLPLRSLALLSHVLLICSFFLWV